MKEKPQAPPESFEPDARDKAMVYACGPHPGGNSDLTADLLAQGVVQAGGQSQIIHLRRFSIRPCIGCDRCRHDRDGCCIFKGKDDAAMLFQPLLSAPLVFFTSPIYFYHLPSLFKGFIDRGQNFYNRLQGMDPLLMNLPRRTAHIALVAGQTKGEKLFKGSMLTLKYFLQPFNMEPALLPLRGLDKPHDLRKNQARQEEILQYAKDAWSAL